MTTRKGGTWEPDWTMIPGETLRELLHERKWTQRQFADMIGTSQVVISDVMMGRRSITPLIALRFEEATGVRAEFWCRLQANYDITTLRLSKASDSEVIPEQPDSEGADKP